MIVAAHQIHFMPGLRYFSKMSNCDIFVYLDDVQFVKREFQNRNRIRTASGWQYLTVPVITKSRYYQTIKDVEINNTFNWRIEHLKAIETNYKKAKFFDVYFPKIKEIYDKEYRYLIDISLSLINFFRKELSLNTKTIFSSSLNINSKSTQRLVDICLKIGGNVYLSGVGAKEYLNVRMFESKNIKVIWQDFKVKEYKQVFDGFISDMSILDLLLNCGIDSIKYL
ncbi:MAG: WbqC family protein [Elusimicrobiales bacterium]|nr:WbqC family protein [Elusimicrobiales bacterium]